jgi:hypothetical protein
MTLFLLFLSLLMTSINCLAQSKLGFENYHYLGQPGAALVVPIIHFETKNKGYAELRYNYEDMQTLSLYGGKTFSTGKDLHFSITPMVGLSTGKFTGASVAANAELEWKNFYGSSQTQYSMGLKKGMTNFFFSWSELGYNISRYFFTGVAMQFTRKKAQEDIEPGFLAGFNFKSFSFPFYVFSPFRPRGYFVLGLNYEYNWIKKNK